jgi:hypothetical protein
MFSYLTMLWLLLCLLATNGMSLEDFPKSLNWYVSRGLEWTSVFVSCVAVWLECGDLVAICGLQTQSIKKECISQQTESQGKSLIQLKAHDSRLRWIGYEQEEEEAIRTSSVPQQFWRWVLSWALLLIMNLEKVGCIDCLHSFQEISSDWSSFIPLTNDYIKTLHPDAVSRTSSPFSPPQRT